MDSRNIGDWTAQRYVFYQYVVFVSPIRPKGLVLGLRISQLGVDKFFMG